jgi:hypothetical protein
LLASQNQIESISVENLPQNLKVLELDNNKLQIIEKSVVERLKELSLKRLKFGHNPWKCDCSNWNFIYYVNQISKANILDHQQVKCNDNDREFSDFTKDNICFENIMLIITLSIATAVMGLLLGTLAALYYKYQKQIKMWMYAHKFCLWFVTEDELDEVCDLLKVFKKIIVITSKTLFRTNSMMPLSATHTEIKTLWLTTCCQSLRTDRCLTSCVSMNVTGRRVLKSAVSLIIIVLIAR